MTPFKIAINGPEESELIQEILFKLGYKWAMGETIPLYCFVMKYLYLDTHITFSCDIDFDRFVSKKLREITFEQFLNEIEEQIK